MKKLVARISNIVTSFRIFGALLAAFCYWQGLSILTLGILLSLIGSNLLVNWWARSFSDESLLENRFNFIADKVLIISMIIMLALDNQLYINYVLLVLARNISQISFFLVLVGIMKMPLKAGANIFSNMASYLIYLLFILIIAKQAFFSVLTENNAIMVLDKSIYAILLTSILFEFYMLADHFKQLGRVIRRETDIFH
ncbi:MAG: hypothetical protein JJV97_02535 [SAR324 cluster bacterium]|nr:hypothetical protein [SAR324 cluster bacterium]